MNKHRFGVKDKFGKKLLKMRVEHNSYLITLLKFVLERWSVAGELYVLRNICRVLNDHGLAYSRSEVKTCMNKYYDQEKHSAELRSRIYDNAVDKLPKNLDFSPEGDFEGPIEHDFATSNESEATKKPGKGIHPKGQSSA